MGILGKPTGSSTSDAGHAILTDGYGYYNGQLYIHLNFGWSGSDDAWYTPSDADTGAIINPSGYNYTSTGARSVRVSRTVGDDPVKSGNNYTGSYYDRASNSNSYGNDITMEEDDLPQAATPTSATPAEFETSTNVTLVCSTSGASIYYTSSSTDL